MIPKKNTKQRAVTNMGAGQDDEVAVGIVADPSNYSAEQFFEKQLALSTAKCPDCRHYKVTPDPLTQNIGNHSHTMEIGSKFNKGYQVVIAIVGIPDASSYKEDMHRLLDGWKNAADKPALLLVSSVPELTRRIVESWDEWESLPDELKAAIKVNDEYLVINGNKALDVLKERVKASKALQDALSRSLSNDLDGRVAEPTFTRSKTLSVPPVRKV